MRRGILLVCIFFVGCVNKITLQNEIRNGKNESVEIEIDCSYDTIYLKETLTHRPVLSQIYDTGDHLEYITWDKDSIYYADYKVGYIKKSTRIPKQCGNLNSFSGFYVHSFDSIFVYNYWNGILYLFNDKGFVTKKWNIFLSEKKNKFPLYPRCLNYSPIIFYKNNVVLSGTNYGHTQHVQAKDSPISLIVNLYNDSISDLLGYPEFYEKANFGGEFCKLVYHTLNSKNGLVVYSFPMSHDLYFCSNGIKNKYAGSKYIKFIKSSNITYNKMLNDNKSMIKYYVSTPTYANVLYDKYRNFYYRIAEHPLLEWQSNSKIFVKPFSIIVMDDNFNVIGESQIIDDINYYRYNIHVIPEGIIIQKLNPNEDIIIFSLFKITSK